MALKAAMWVHGTATEVEFPQNLHSDGVVREGIGTHFFGGAGTFNWFHIPIPTPVVLDGVRPTLVGVFLFYNVEGRIRNMHIWDGPFRVKQFDNLNLGGNHLNGIDKDNTWTLTPPITIRFGLKLTIGVEYASLFDPPLPGEPRPKIDFLVAAAGADFQ
jgi:hypothetical protein